MGIVDRSNVSVVHLQRPTDRSEKFTQLIDHLVLIRGKDQHIPPKSQFQVKKNDHSPGLNSR